MRTGMLLFGAMLCVVISGCDGDGDDSTAQPAMQPQGGMDLTGATWVLGQGTDTATTNENVVLKGFSITEPGLLEVTLTWDSGPGQMGIVYVMPEGILAGDVKANGTSPVNLSTQVPQAIIDQQTNWQLVVRNTIGPDTDVHYTIYFTPDS